jgi:hypothetical protein
MRATRVALALVTGGQDLRGQLDGVGEVPGNLSEGGDEEVAEVVAAKPVAGAEAMGEELHQQIFLFAERHHAVAQVAGGQHVEVFAQAAGRAAVIGDSDHGGKVGDGGWIKSGLAGGTDVAAKSTQQGGKAGSAANGHHPQRMHGGFSLDERRRRRTGN